MMWVYILYGFLAFCVVVLICAFVSIAREVRADINDSYSG